MLATAVLGAMLVLAGGSAASAQTTNCDISRFIRPDDQIDVSGYLACIQGESLPKPAADCPTADLQVAATADPNTVYVGQSSTFTAYGFAPNGEVELFICSTPISLGRFVADANGQIVTTVTIPTGTVLGAHTLAAVGVAANGNENQVAYAAINVVESTTVTGTLPRTGSDNGRLIALGAALIAVGGAAVIGSMRGRKPATVPTND